jgi:hypothetical protein
MVKRRDKNTRVTYYPPAADDIRRYTHTLCEKLGKTLGAEFDTPEVRNELAGFIKVVAKICSKQLNQSTDELDTKKSEE